MARKHVGAAGRAGFTIDAEWVRSPDQVHAGVPERPEDEASLARLSLQVGSVALVRAEDRESGSVRPYSVLSASAFAEWLAWHWWRLCWEPRRPGAVRSLDWARAHRVQGIGGGWLWPPVTLTSDGERMALRAEPSRGDEGQPLRYLADEVCVIPLMSFQAAVDGFVDRVLAQLEAHGLRGRDLQAIWRELAVERADPELARYRRTEALLGYDPDEADPDTIESVLRDAEAFGQGAMFEVAGMGGEEPLTADRLADWARQEGFEGRAGDRVALAESVERRRADTPAWRLGVEAARALRNQERLGDRLLSNTCLSGMCGVDEGAVSVRDTSRGKRVGLAFDLVGEGNGRRVVLRSRWEAGRRFELARLLGDHLMDTETERLHPATNTYTYRQKMQRAFVAELLAPLESLAGFLDDGDTAEEAIEDAAAAFEVSPWVVTRVLVNGGYLPPDFLNDADPESIAV